PALSVVELSVTYQEYDQSRPWRKEKEQHRHAYGCLLPSGDILTTADIIRDYTLIKVERPGAQNNVPAKVRVVDYDVDLALLSVDEAGYLEGMVPVSLDEDAAVGERVEIAVFDEGGRLHLLPARIVTIEVGSYFLGLNRYLRFGASVNFEGRGGGWSEGVFSARGLTGLSMSYEADEEYMTIIPAAIIRRFLESARPEGYLGFAGHGFDCTGLESPDLRSYLGLPPEGKGVYIDSVYPSGSAAGVLEPGDVLLSVAGRAIDARGYYLDPRWGQIEFGDLFSRHFGPGDRVEVEIFRAGEKVSKELTLKRETGDGLFIPLYGYGEPPPYRVVGGLVFQEVTKGYLEEWGRDWLQNAPEFMLYYYTFQLHERPDGRRRLVVLNTVLPDPVNIGYQDFREKELVAVNGVPIRSLEDLEPALARPLRGFHRFGFSDFGREIVLGAEGLGEADRRIAANYGLPAPERTGPKPLEQ
ncbi:MAG TPA: hypothetical protein PK636_05815, partial [bacterium]|nr:hypothetical protein [bacterium]